MESGTEGPASLHLFICLAIWNLNRTIELNKNHSITIVLQNIIDKSHIPAVNMLQSVSKSHNKVTISVLLNQES